jgi:hypothetical protein
MNVQNGVLKSLSFMFEYVGEMSKDYIYAITPLLEDALMDRALVHRQSVRPQLRRRAHTSHELRVAQCVRSQSPCHQCRHRGSGRFFFLRLGMRVSIGAGAVLMYVL